jgi:hypothetical protein
MTDIYYSHSFEPQSEAVAKVYYSEKDRLLFVQTVRDGALAGYDEVPYETYRNFALADSAGAYWNTMVKPNYPGFSTADVNLVSEFDAEEGVDPADALVELTEDLGLYEDGVDEEVTEPVKPARRYVVSVEVTQTIQATVYAEDLDKALVQVHEHFENDSNVKDYRFLSATQFFE